MGRVHPALGLVLIAMACAACGDETDSGGGPTESDAGTDASTPPKCAPGEAELADGSCRPAGVLPEACGEGFAPDGMNGCTVTLPSAPCAEGTMAIPGETTCREVAPCGAGTWGDLETDAATEFVDGSYAGTDSDGTEQHPWTTVQAAVDAAEPGALVAIAAGDYKENVAIAGKPVRLRGKCPSQVAIWGQGDAFATVLVTNASGTEIGTLALRGIGDGIAISGATGMQIDRVWIHGTTSRGVDVEGALGPADVTITGSLIEGVREVGAYVGGAVMRVDGTVVRAIAATPAKTGGSGMIAENLQGEPTELSIQRSLVADTKLAAIVATGAVMTIESVAVLDTATQLSDGTGGHGVFVQIDGMTGVAAQVTIAKTVVERAHSMGINVSGGDARIEGTVVRDTMQEDNGAFGRGLNVQPGVPLPDRNGTVTVVGCTFERNREVGVAVIGGESHFESVVVRDTLPREGDGDLGRGINVQNASGPAVVTIASSLVQRNSEAGIFAIQSDVTVVGTAILDTAPRLFDGLYGDGVSVASEGLPSKLAMSASLVTGSARAGISCFGSEVVVAASILACNAIALDSETSFGTACQFSDQGDNQCGCGEGGACAVLTSDLAPPAPLAP